MVKVPTLFILFFLFFCTIPLAYSVEIFTIALLNYIAPERDEYTKYQIFFLSKPGLIGTILTFFLAMTTMKNCGLIEFTLFAGVYFLILFYSVLLLVFCYFSDSKDLEVDSFVNASVWLLFSLCSFLFVKNYITFALNVELIAICYLFFFLQFAKNSQKTLFKLKNLFMNYLFASLFTLIFLILVIIFLSSQAGTLDFYETLLLTPIHHKFPWVLLLIAIFWKLGTPLFYFFKLELYKLLPTTNLVFFSISSFLINSFIFIFLYASCQVMYTGAADQLLVVMLIANIVVLWRGTNINTLAFFIGMSAINTWGVLLAFFLVNGKCFF